MMHGTMNVKLQSKTKTVAGMHSKETRTRDPGSRMPEDRFWKGNANSDIIWHYSCIISMFSKVQLNTLLRNIYFVILRSAYFGSYRAIMRKRERERGRERESGREREGGREREREGERIKGNMYRSLK